MSKAPHINIPVQASKAIDPLAISRICGLADAGEIEQAAAAATLNFVNGAYAVAPFVVWLGAGFARGGPTVLPQLLKQAGEQLRTDQVVRPLVISDWIRSLNWLADNMRSRVRFHAKFHDQVWDRWCASLTPHLQSEIDAACDVLTQSASEALRSDVDEILQGLVTMTRRTFGPLLPVIHPEVAEEVEVVNVVAGGAPQASQETASSEQEPELTDSSRSQLAGSTLPPRDTVDVHSRPEHSSSPMRALQAKLHAFDKLAHEQAWPLAAMVARDIERELSQFDPVRYFPQYFSKYLNTLCEVGAELEMHMQPADSLESQALERLYHADPERFLAKLNGADTKA